MPETKKLGKKITDLEEAQASGLTDNNLLIVEPETPPTKKMKLSTLWAWIKSKIAAWTLGSYDEIMAATNAGYIPDALAVKQGFTQLNTKLDDFYTTKKVNLTLTNVTGTQPWKLTAPSIDGFRMIGYVSLTQSNSLSVNVGAEGFIAGSYLSGFANRYSGTNAYTVFIEATFLYIRT